MKKEIKAAICVVLALWLFFIGFEVGSIREKKVLTKELAASATQVTTDVGQSSTAVGQTEVMQPSTEATQPTSEDAKSTAATGDETTVTAADAQSDANNETTQQTSDAAPVADPSSLSKEEILKNVTDAMNALANEKNMTAKKTESVNVQLTELSVDSAKDFVNSIIQNLVGDETEEYTFVNGVGSGTDDKGKAVENVTVLSVIPPNEGFKLTADGIASATAEKKGDSTVYTIKIVEERTTFTSPVPTHNAAAFSYLDLTSIDVKGATITDANMHYPGTTITVTVNSDGKVTNLHYNMPMDGDGTAKILFATGAAKFEGSDDETWEISY